MKKSTRIKIVVVKPCEEPQMIIVGNKLENFQKIVGGRIEYVPYKKFDIVIDEEGKCHKNLVNRKFFDDILVGTFFVTKADGEGAWVSLTDDEVREIKEEFKTGSKEFPALLGVWEGI